MSGNFLEDMGLRMEGFNEEQIAQIEAAIPTAQAFVALAQRNQPAITAALALIQKLMPTINMALTVIKEKSA
jgi:hypothetical protein